MHSTSLILFRASDYYFFKPLTSPNTSWSVPLNRPPFDRLYYADYYMTCIFSCSEYEMEGVREKNTDLVEREYKGSVTLNLAWCVLFN